jgi:MFS family permease
MNLFQSKWTPLFSSNFVGVFNDNLLKNCIIFIAVGWSLPAWMTQSQLISLVSASLVLPYIFLSPLAGRLAVIYSKKKVFSLCKLLEIAVLSLACVSFYYQWVMVAVFSVLLMGILSCLYSPAKYSLIRDIGGESGVSYGSGVFEMMAFLGILVGTVTASIVSDFYNQWLVFGLYMGLAIIGYIFTRAIRVTELPEDKSENVQLNPIRFLINSFRFAHQYKLVNAAVFGASSFWLIGGMLQMNLVIHSKQIYYTSNSTTGMVMAIAAIGIALGCWAAGKISGSEVKKGLVLIGLGGMILMFIALTFFKLSFLFYLVCIFIVAFMGGIFQIPCLSMIQKANLGRKLGDIIAYLNLVTFVFVLFGTFFFSLTTHFTNENSFAVFGVILAICLLVSSILVISSSEFWNETKKIILTIFKSNHKD